jgi:hypothetical protein
MNFALVYLAGRFLFRIGDFFHHWYIDSSRVFFHAFISSLERLDRTLAVHVTLRHFTEPLYGDYTIVGRILGVFFRTWRVLIGAVVYLAVGMVFLAVFLLWLLVPPSLIFYALRAI